MKFITKPELIHMLGDITDYEWKKIRSRFPFVRVGTKNMYPLDEIKPLVQQYMQQKRYKWWEQLPIANGD